MDGRTIRLMWVVVAAWFLATATGLGGDWPQWRYDAERTGASPETLPAALNLQWVRRLPTPQPAWPPDQYKLQFDLSYAPVAAGGMLFVPSMVRDRVTAYDTETGRERWRFYADGPVRFAPAVQEGRVYFVSDDGCLYCVRAEDGALIWKHRGGPSEERLIGNGRLISAWPARGAPVLADGLVYFAASIWPFMGTFIRALDARTGAVAWTNSGSGSVYVLQQHTSPAFAGVAPQGYLTVAGSRVLISGGRTVPAAHDRGTGEFLYFRVWERKGGKSAGGYEVSAHGGVFYNGGIAYNLADGGLMMRVPWTVLGAGAAYGTGPDGSLAAWAYPEIPRKGSVRQTPKPRALWQAAVDAPLGRVMIQAGRRVYGTTREGEAIAVDLPADGRAARISWRARVEGEVWDMLAADGRLFVVTRDGAIWCFGGKKVDVARYDERTAADEPAPATAGAKEILKRAGVKAGYCLMLGAGDTVDAAALARASELRVIVIDAGETPRVGSDPAVPVDGLRRQLDAAGLYGVRMSVHAGGPGSISLPPYMASLVVAGAAWTRGAALEQLFRSLRPYGGTACFRPAGQERAQLMAALSAAKLPGAQVEASGDWVLLRRAGPLPDSAWWTHQYGDAANTVVSEDGRVKAPLGLLWFGGPSNAKILPRHGHGPSPEVVGGRLLIEGPDVLRAVDVYTGRVLWETELTGLGRFYDNTSHEPGANAIGSNYASAEDGVYVIYGRKCLRLSPETGRQMSTFECRVPAADGPPAAWGFVAVWKDLLLGGLEPMSFWEPDFSAGEFKRWNNGQLTELLRVCRAWGGAGQKDLRAAAADGLNRMIADPRLGAAIPAADRAAALADKEKAARVAAVERRIAAHLKADAKADRTLRELNRLLLQEFYRLPAAVRPTPGRRGIEGVASRVLVAMDRHTGKVLWRFESRYALRHNAIAVGGGKVFVIDRLPDPVVARMRRRGIEPTERPRLVALDARTGREVWRTETDVFGTWLGYSAPHDVLLEAGSWARDRARDETPRGLATYRGADGRPIWRSDLRYSGPCMLHGRTIIHQGGALDLLTGEPRERTHPMTGEAVPWTFVRNYGCNTAIASRYLLTFRSAAAGYYDLERDGGTGNLGGFKSGCTSNLIAADGVLNAPDYTRTCTCSYQNQTSLALVHDPAVETWTFTNLRWSGRPVRRVGLNLGAPGDRLSDAGTLWLDYPSVGGPSPDLPVVTVPAKPETIRYHASRIVSGPLPWVGASGLRDLKSLTVTLAREATAPRNYTVRLLFAELEGLTPGKRVFGVSLQGREVLRSFDVAVAAGGPNRVIAREFKKIPVTTTLTISLSPVNASGPAHVPVLCGVEIVEE